MTAHRQLKITSQTGGTCTFQVQVDHLRVNEVHEILTQDVEDARAKLRKMPQPPKYVFVVEHEVLHLVEQLH